MSADTDDAGHYEFKDLKAGSYTISINQAGFAPFTKTLEVKAGEAAIVDIVWSWRPCRSKSKSAKQLSP